MQQAYRTAAFLFFGSQNFSRPAFLKHAQSFPPSDSDFDLKGKNVVVTGANAGIGKSAATLLASKGATLYCVCRNKERGEAAVSEIKTKTGNENVYLEVVDMSSLSQIREFAKKYSESGKSLNVLVNNAGVMVQERKESPDGLEMNFAVNVAGIFTLTELLIPVMKRSGENAKAICVATGGILTEPLYHDVQMEKTKSFDGTTAYARNKRLQSAITEKWAEKYGTEQLGFYTMHPGWVDTVTLENAMPGFYKTFKNRLRLPDEGADTIFWLAGQPNKNLSNGGFYFDRAEAKKHLPGAGTTYTRADMDELYAKVKNLCGLPV